MNLFQSVATRRSALMRMAGLFGAVVAAAGRARAFVQSKPAEIVHRRGTSQNKAWWGMAIDLDLCTGCGSCVVACRSENNVPHTGTTPEDGGTRMAWMDLLPKSDEAAGAALPELLPMPCMQCENPPCIKVCPVNATYQNEEGIVAQVWDRCIGCRYCEVACPYSRVLFNWKEPEWPESHKNCLNPDVATRPEGVVEKCTFCHHRIRALREDARVEERDITDADVQRLPACAQSCPAEAIVFGDLADPDSRVTRMANSSRSSRLLEHLGTKPKVFYLARERRIDG